jgi:hypothetical protein
VFNTTHTVCKAWYSCLLWCSDRLFGACLSGFCLWCGLPPRGELSALVFKRVSARHCYVPILLFPLLSPAAASGSCCLCVCRSGASAHSPTTEHQRFPHSNLHTIWRSSLHSEHNNRLEVVGSTRLRGLLPSRRPERCSSQTVRWVRRHRSVHSLRRRACAVTPCATAHQTLFFAWHVNHRRSGLIITVTTCDGASAVKIQ